MKPYFLNVDLEIESNSKLDSISTDMGKRVMVMHSGPGFKKRHLLTMGLAGYTNRGPDAMIRGFCAIVAKLPPSSRKIWNRAEKVFDVGLEQPAIGRSSQFQVGTETLKLITKVGASLVVTYYRADEEDGENSTTKQP